MAKKQDNKEECCQYFKYNPFVAIPATLTGIFLALSILYMLFAQGAMIDLVGILWGFVVLGIFALFFAFLAEKRKDK